MSIEHFLKIDNKQMFFQLMLRSKKLNSIVDIMDFKGD